MLDILGLYRFIYAVKTGPMRVNTVYNENPQRESEIRYKHFGRAARRAPMAHLLTEGKINE